MPTLAQALQQPDMDKLVPVKKGEIQHLPASTQNSPGPSSFGRGPVPGINADSDGLRQFYRAPGVPQYRVIPSAAGIGGDGLGTQGIPGLTGPQGVPGSRGPVGPAGPGASFTYNETPGGVIDGANDTFTLINAPSPSSSLVFAKNGMVLTQGIGYTISGSTITYDPAYIPIVGDTHRALLYQS